MSGSGKVRRTRTEHIWQKRTVGRIRAMCGRPCGVPPRPSSAGCRITTAKDCGRRGCRHVVAKIVGCKETEECHVTHSKRARCVHSPGIPKCVVLGATGFRSV